MSIGLLGEGLKIVANNIKDVASKVPDFTRETTFTAGDFREGAMVSNFSGVREFMPRNGGMWTGEPGDSRWKPSPEDIPKKQNPEELTWKEILAKYNIDDIVFKNGFPEFSEIAEEVIKIDDFSLDRNGNFVQADKKIAEKWTAENKDGKEWTATDVRNYRSEKNLTWHEHEDKSTLQLVPSEVHNNISHSGGIAEKKKEEAV